MLLSLKPGIIYGPVTSRRLGKSLGINLMPGKDKLCSFNCVYCHYGWTKRHTIDFSDYKNDLPKRDNIVTAVQEALQSSLEFDYITFSGNGEPSLHPDFSQSVEDIIELRDRFRPHVKLGLLSNSTGLVHKCVRDCVSRIEFPMFKLDAGTERTFNAINRPAPGIDFCTIINHLSSLFGILIQTVLIDGSPTNINDDELAAYFEQIRRIRPREVHIYSIDRPVPKTDIRLVPPERLEQIAARGRRDTGIQIKAFYPRQERPHGMV